MKSLQLSPEGPFSEIPRSDTLFGAICWGIRHSRGEETLEDILARFAEDDPPFLVSSAFPTVTLPDDGGRLHLLPKPRLPGPRSGGETVSDERIEALQAWKRIAYIPAALLAEIARGERSGSDVVDGLEESAVDIDGQTYQRDREFLLPAELESVGRPYETETRVRNAVNRLTGATGGNLFERESVFFAEKAGLHICVKGDIDTVVEALAVLQDRGIGGGKSVGQGQFRLDGVEEVGEFPAASDAEWFCTLSLCIPRSERLAEVVEEGFYSIETRKGVVGNAAGSDIWKRRVLALAEGSVLPRLGASHGYNPIVADHFEHGVQQYGYALPVGFER